tara:strand:+ start:6546 stop:7703 length:1158 start_codon:yes stop_codon:yes gene_type:complete
MTLTNFGSLTTEQKAVWSRQLWDQSRNMSFIEKFIGNDFNAPIHRITELTPTERGDRAIVTLVADIEGDGVVGDKVLEGNEAPINAYDEVIRIDQLRQGNRHEGRMAAQKTVVNFREQSKDKLAYWLADRRDQVAILTMSGVAYTFTNKGGTRPVLGGGSQGQNLSELIFASDVTAPTAQRHTRWDAGTSALISAAATSDIVAADKLCYAAVVEAKAYAKDIGLRGVKQKEGMEEQYHLIVTPQSMKHLKLDSAYLENQRSAGQRGEGNILFKGSSSVLVDGVWIHEFRHIFNTEDAVSGTAKWGSGSDVNGSRCLFMGAQALAIADITKPNWVEKGFDYDNQQGIAIDMITGVLKPQFKTPFNKDSNGLPTLQDHGLFVLDVAY